MTTPTSRTSATARPVSRVRRAVGGSDRERGLITLEIAILFPVLLAVIVAIVQYGLWYHARSLALAAAQQGVTAARTYTAEPAAGTQAAREFLDTHAADTLTSVTITTATAGPGQVGVQVSGRAMSIVPGIPGLDVTQSAAGPIERFTTAGAP